MSPSHDHVTPSPASPDAHDLTGMRALVTGGGSGIGRAIAGALTAHGAVVHVADIDPTTSPDHVVDVSDAEAVSQMFSTIDRDLGGLDILVNNMGVAGPTGRVDLTDPDEFDRCLQVNAGSTFRCTSQAARRMVGAGSGAIVNISSTAGHFGYPLRSAYAASKWAIEGLTATWAMELGRFGVRVNAVCPGSVGGPRMDGVIQREAQSLGTDPDSIRNGYTDQVSMRSFVDATDIAAMVTFLVSPAARFVNGEVISVDGHTETLRTTWPDQIRLGYRT